MFIVHFILFVSFIFSSNFVYNSAEIFSVNPDAQTGAYGGNNPTLLATNGQIFNNPALGNIKSKDYISFTSRNHFSGLAKDYIFSTVIKQSFIKSLSLGFLYREVDDIPDTRNAFYFDGNIPVPIDYELIKFSKHWELGSIISLSHTINNNKIGMNLKSLLYSLFNQKAYGFSLDIGSIYNISDDILTGFIFKNVPFLKINWSTGHSEIMIPTFQIGIHYLKTNFDFVMGFKTDLSFANGINDYNSVLNFGFKKKINDRFNFLAGYNTSLSYSLGAEIKYRSFLINYAYINSPKKIPFKSSHELTFGIEIDKLNYLGKYIKP
tara:strand:- start:1608 stop:2573 length:966 start_codon:yes stop_codon:yes gene_type:complete